MRGPGETAVSASFLTGVALARVRSPFPATVPESAYASAARVNAIDDLVLDKLRQLHIEPSPLCTDGEFIRRAYLDAAGILPTRDEVERFLADSSPDKRARLVDALLARDEFVDYWAYKWSDVLLVSSRTLGPNNVRDFYGWIRAAVKSNMPWDKFVYAIATAQGRTDQNGAANYYLIHRSPIDLAENYTQAFLGLTLTCARCHNHPMEKWTQIDYYGFTNLFARVSVKDDGTFAGKNDTATVFSTPDGDVLHPRLGIALPPRPLDGTPMPAHSTEDRREYLAKWTTSPSNTLFRPRDREPRLGELLRPRPGAVRPTTCGSATRRRTSRCFQEMTADFVQGGFDVKALIRTIMLSAAYQRSSVTTPANVERRPLLLALPDSPAAGRSDPGRVFRSDRRAGDVHGLPEGHPRAAAARHERGLVLPVGVRTARADHHVGRRADAGPDAAAGAARDQRRHAEQEADERSGRDCADGRGGEVERRRSWSSCICRRSAGRPTDAERDGILPDLDRTPAADATAHRRRWKTWPGRSRRHASSCSITEEQERRLRRVRRWPSGRGLSGDGVSRPGRDSDA